MVNNLLHQFIQDSAERTPSANALLHKQTSLDYRTLWLEVQKAAAGMRNLGLCAGDRVAVYLPKQPETVIALFAASAAGATFVPVNPILKPDQVGYILRDCNVRILVTSPDRATLLSDILQNCPDLRHVVVVGTYPDNIAEPIEDRALSWDKLITANPTDGHRRIDADMAAILYTSGSTGRPKGVVLSHRNMVAGAYSVATYLENTAQDRLLAVLPFSFDYGLSQLTTAFSVGASVLLMDYLLPRDVIRAVDRHCITGLAAVPPLWNQLATLEWPDGARQSLRYITNSGGAMPLTTTNALHKSLPNTSIYLMYGLTEAFRSTYLPPGYLGKRPDSMGKAIPNAEVLVVREDGTECEPGEPGELVHRGALVAMGYWNDPEKTAERFRPAPGQPSGIPTPEIAVWSGDQVRRDDEGFLYFISRKDEMIKTSGYRVSPTEVEEVAYGAGNISQAVALGIPHPMLGQAIILVVQKADDLISEASITEHCRRHLPMYMIPAKVVIKSTLPRNANGKIDRRSLSDQFQDLFSDNENS